MKNNVFLIRSSKNLRNNYSQISKLTRENPVVITVNGKEDTVIMSHDDFIYQQNHIKDLEEKLAFYEHLELAEDYIKLGRITKSSDVFASLNAKLENIRL